MGGTYAERPRLSDLATFRNPLYRLTVLLARQVECIGALQIIQKSTDTPKYWLSRKAVSAFMLHFPARSN